MSLFAIISLIYGSWMILVGIPLLLNSKEFHETIDTLGKSSANLLGFAFFAVTIGLVVLGIEHRLVANNWMWVVPLLGWVSVVKGVLLILFPGLAKFMVKKFWNPGTTSMIAGLIVILIGVFLLWLAFKVY